MASAVALSFGTAFSEDQYRCSFDPTDGLKLFADSSKFEKQLAVGSFKTVHGVPCSGELLAGGTSKSTTAPKSKRAFGG